MSASTRVDDDLAYLPETLSADLDVLLVYNLLRTHSHLAALVDADLKQQQLTAAQLNVLLALRSAGETGLLMGEIGQHLVVAKSNVTSLVDRLEAQGLVARAEHADRRATVVRLTPAGEALLEKAAPRHAKQLAQLGQSLSREEKRALIGLLTKLRRELRQRRRGE